MKRVPLESRDTENSPSGDSGDAAAREPATHRSLAEVARERTLFLAAATLTSGLALTGTVSATAGGVVIVASWVFFVVALHRYGRTGGATKRD